MYEKKRGNGIGRDCKASNCFFSFGCFGWWSNFSSWRKRWRNDSGNKKYNEARLMEHFDKRGGGWTVHKLITLIMLVLVLAIIVGGAITGGLNPMFKRLREKFDNVLAKFGLGEDNQKQEGGCFPWEPAEGFGSDIEKRVCRGYCEMKDGEINYTYFIGTGGFEKNGEDIIHLLDYDERLDYDEKKLYDSVQDSRDVCEIDGKRVLCLMVESQKRETVKLYRYLWGLIRLSKEIDSITYITKVYYLKDGRDLWVEETVYSVPVDERNFGDYYAKNTKPREIIKLPSSFAKGFIFGTDKEDLYVLSDLETLKKNKEIYLSLKDYCK